MDGLARSPCRYAQVGGDLRHIVPMPSWAGAGHILPTCLGSRLLNRGWKRAGSTGTRRCASARICRVEKPLELGCRSSDPQMREGITDLAHACRHRSWRPGISCSCPRSRARCPTTAHGGCTRDGTWPSDTGRSGSRSTGRRCDRTGQPSVPLRTAVVAKRPRSPRRAHRRSPSGGPTKVASTSRRRCRSARRSTSTRRRIEEGQPEIAHCLGQNQVKEPTEPSGTKRGS
jgi:hypothetical protein